MTTSLSERAWVFDPRIKRKCVYLETLLLSPSDWPKGFPVDIVPEDDTNGEPITAQATISEDRKTITFKVDGNEVFQAEATDLLRDMHKAHPNRFEIKA